METKKKKNHFLNIVGILFIIFLIVYIIGESGYYEASKRKDVELTEESIKKFEEDVLNGDTVDLNTYILEENKDYSNVFTETGEKISSGVINIFSNTFEGIANVFSFLF